MNLLKSFDGGLSVRPTREQRNHGLKYDSDSVSIGIGIKIKIVEGFAIECFF
jgi:hypothetical protein